MHDVVWQALIAAFVTIILAWMQQRTRGAVDKGAAEATAAASDAAKGTRMVAGELARTAATQHAVAAAATVQMQENTELTRAANERVGAVAEAVNGQREAMLSRIDALEKALARALEARKTV